MSFADDTFQQYVELRTGGRDAKSALEALRLRIELLDANDKAELVRRVRAWETKRTSGGSGKPEAPPNAPSSAPPSSAGAPSSSPPPSGAPSSSEPPPDTIRQRLAQAASRSSTTPVPTPVTEDMVRCPHCRKPNKATDVFCFSCGEFLRKDKVTNFDTVRFDDTGSLPSADYFGEESTLILAISGVKDTPRFRIRPQESRHEVVIGRSDGGTVRPDIDLAAHNASDLGVSRLHVALQHNKRNNILSISDMKSANGTYVNGQKLYPQEVRVLRHGDELRLGRMVLRVYFEHGKTVEKSG
ncbi:MAG: FHA domain-containing protein [Anaerolineae bacterium]|nr:FHA domain-containing protein [Anaerolineae bacterium]